jgi:hypothetical protein
MSPFWRLWGWPLVLAVLSAIGLISALVADGVWDGVSWLLLTAPVAVSVIYGLRRHKAPSRRNAASGEQRAIAATLNPNEGAR